MYKLLIFFFNRSLLDIVEKNKNRFSKLESSPPPISVHNLKWGAKFQIYRLYIRDSDWLNSIHFSGYKYMIRLVSML